MIQKFSVLIKKKIKKFNKTIFVEGDKSISHRALLVASQCVGQSTITGILKSEDVNNTVVCLKKLGVKIFEKNKKLIVFGCGLSSFKNPHKNQLYMGNSGTLARMLIALLSTQKNLKIKIFGDESLNRRDMKRVIYPLSKIGCNFYPKGKTTLPITVEGTDMPMAQNHVENIGSAQVKSAILFSALNTPGTTTIYEKKLSRNHTENILTAVQADIKIKKTKKGNIISLKGEKDLASFNLEIPGDPSSAAPFIALTLLTPRSKLLIKNVNCNPTRLGFIRILKKMNANIKIIKLKEKMGEPIGNIFVKSSFLKPINCPRKLVPSAIDEFPLLFVVASMIKGTTKFSGIEELRHKESDRIKTMEFGLNQLGIKTKSAHSSLKIFGNPKIRNNKKINIFAKKDHRVAMSFFCLGQILNIKIQIFNFETVNTSFSKFLYTMKKIGANFEIKKKN